MKTTLTVMFLIAVLPLLFSGCASTLTREECGPYPENYAKIAEDYGSTVKIPSAQSTRMPSSIRVTPSPPTLSKDKLHPGWLVIAQRQIVFTGRGWAAQTSMPFQIIIYDGRIVWTSDDRDTKPR